MCLTLCGWGLWREKKEWWLRAPKRALLEDCLLLDSGVNCSWLLLPPPLSSVVTREAADLSGKDIWNKRSNTDAGLSYTIIFTLFPDKNRWKLPLKTTSLLSIAWLEFISNKNRSWRLYLWEQPSTANCTDECCPGCQETWTKHETMASAHNVWVSFSIAFILMGFSFSGYATGQRSLVSKQETLPGRKKHTDQFARAPEAWMYFYSVCCQQTIFFFLHLQRDGFRTMRTCI